MDNINNINVNNSLNFLSDRCVHLEQVIDWFLNRVRLSDTGDLSIIDLPNTKTLDFISKQIIEHQKLLMHIESKIMEEENNLYSIKSVDIDYIEYDNLPRYPII